MLKKLLTTTTLAFIITTSVNAQDFRYRYKADGVILQSGIVEAGTTPNRAPVINTSSLDQGAENSVYSFTLSGTDADGDSLEWSITEALPNGLSLNSSTGEISGTPTEGGDFNLTINVSDGEDTTSKSLLLDILEGCEFGGVGTVCDSDGAIYVGTLSDNIRRYIASNDLSTRKSWGADNIDVPGISNPTNDFDGEGNTNILTPAYDATDDGTRTGTAAQDCRNDLGSEWYLPAKDELSLIWDNRADLDFNSINLDTGYLFYFTSNEQSSSHAVQIRFSDGIEGYPSKDSTRNVRCFRK